ncbi:RICIN domain-containing protein [Dactylosporangium roseum]|uniref:RICIN domain-containing protein n=1 Tax=Dactylosporangium roseum TaxID=47989 RepID=A0ABY5Z0B5_9ACTN|nr:ricin-type beta-trefoil lectin domain protein [Dactylosporangium roseum]UWZ35466.1 RICIN domain-containing protein [Dactylosporangium roseum]
MRRIIRLFRRDDRGSLPLAMLLTLVGTSLSTLMVPIVITQVRDTARTVERAKALHAAQSGIDVVIGGIRASGGSIAKLMCFPADDPLLGVVGGGLPGRYRVSVRFQDVAKTDLPCVTRVSRLLSVPSFAVITSTGTVQGTPGAEFLPATSRTLTATYVFRFTNENIEGGLVRFLGGSYCLDAGSGSPAVGTIVTTQPCSAGSSRQTFAYTKSLTLRLVSSRTAANPHGMCLDSGPDPVPGTLVQFRVCGSPTIPYHQRWSINDSSKFQGTKADGSTLSDLCFHAKAGNTAGAFVELSACGGAADNTRVFAPEASVGAGAAGPPAQLVNFKQFGRCVDVTNFNVTLGFLIVWPCKQAPNPVNVGWNQRWTVPSESTGIGTVSGRITTSDGRTTYCLTTAEPDAASKFVTVAACPTGTDDATRWAVSYQEQSYGTSYVIKDHNGRCLSPTNLDDKTLPANDVFKGTTTVSKLITAPCDGSKLQKWNAPANIEDPSPLKNIGED